MMRTKVKRSFLYVSKWLGLFRLFKFLTRNKLRILCYHGFATGDEIEWRPAMFISADTLRRRLSYLKNQGYSFLTLDEAVSGVSEGKLSALPVVITIDDGFSSTKDIAHPVLRDAGAPYTVYVTSYYSAKQTPIFNLVIQYMFWKTRKGFIDLAELGVKDLVYSEGGSPAVSREGLMKHVVEYGHSLSNNAGRCQLMEQLAQHLEIDHLGLLKRRKFDLLTSVEISEMAADGVDFQLHTHRHRWPMDREDASREIKDNREYLEPLIGKRLYHFCYPSGVWSAEQIPFLREAQVKSATTCDDGLNDMGDSVYRLRRFVDGEHVSDIEFEAMMSGYWGVIKRVASSVLHYTPRLPSS